MARTVLLRSIMNEHFESIDTKALETTSGGVTAQWLDRHPYAAQAYLSHHPVRADVFSANHPHMAARIQNIAGAF